jgi:hypothetical protein
MELLQELVLAQHLDLHPHRLVHCFAASAIRLLDAVAGAQEALLVASFVVHVAPSLFSGCL